MAKYPTEVANLLAIATDASRSTNDRGKAFEHLACLLLDGIPGIEEPIRNRLNQFKTEEVDVAVANLRDPRGLRQFPEVFLIECKNWSAPVGSAEVSYFASRLEHRGCTLGILIAANGVTGDPEGPTAAYFQASAALMKGIRIIVITGADIADLKSDDDFVALLHRRFLGLYACGTFDLV